ncbi:B3 domain-containing protein REM5-like [Euphorbia lathyris]|uniref:B3 domain-containing protein REM5-like n=1 Tax=Euphorbia lathyris TaxID=212925 RepID=UPI003313CAD2
MRSFLWLGVKDRLLTNSDRHRRHLTDSGACSRCRGQVESLCHALRDCSKSKEVWQKVLPHHILPSFFTYLENDWFSNGVKGRLLASMEQEDILFAIICHHLWKWRNNEIFSEKTVFIQNLPEFFSKKLLTITGSFKGEPLANSTQNKEVHLIGWCRLKDGLVKLNTDGSCLNNGKIATSGVLRDAGGAWLSGFTHNLGLSSSFSAELWAEEVKPSTMASCSRKNNGRSLFKSDRPHFFKVILADSIPHQKLCIPRKFVKSFGDYLSNPVILKVPSGQKWKVDVVKCDGEIWLQKGWPEFAEFYSISHGSFLVFEYEKSESEFNVTIFDTSATEIEYPFNEEARVKSARTLKQCRPNDQAQVNRKTLTRAEKRKAVERATSNFQSQNPSFSIVMQPSYVYTSNAFEIPSRFARKYLKKNGDAILNTLDGRTWSIMYYTSTNSLSAATCRFNIFAWKCFAKDNELKVGDVCTFELLEYVDETIFRVVISRYSNLCTGNSKKSKEKESCSKQPKVSTDRPKRGRVAGNCNAKDTGKKMKLQNSVRTLKQDGPKGQVEESRS